MENPAHFIDPMNLYNIENHSKTENYGDKIILLAEPSYKSVVNYPVKLDFVFCLVCKKGHFEGKLNLKYFHAESPGLFIVLADQILQFNSFSDDFSCFALLLSKTFLAELFTNIQVATPLFRSVHDNPWIGLKKEELKSVIEYFLFLQRTLRSKENPNLHETIKHLTLAFFYGTGYRFHQVKESKKSKQDILVEKFLSIVKENYRQHRQIGFYAEKLFLTPKYLSGVIKARSGKSAGEWIEDYIMFEAMALLKSTDKSVQQISYELNFPSQSFFGKYFKRRTGSSPKDFRKGH